MQVVRMLGVFMLPRNESYSFLAILLGCLLCLELFGTDIPSGKPVPPQNSVPAAVALHR